MPACTPSLRAGYDAHVTTLRGSFGSPLPPTMIGRPASSRLRRTSTAAWNWSRSTCRTHRCVIGSSRERSSQSSAAELARHVFPGIAKLLERLAALGQLELHIVNVEERVQGQCLRVQVTGGGCGFQQNPNVAVVQHHWLVKTHVWGAVCIPHQRGGGGDGLQSPAARGPQTGPRGGGP